MRFTITAIVLMLVVPTAFGQSSKFSVGLTEGRNFYSYGLDYIEGAVSQNTYLNYDIGLYGSYSMSEKLAIDISVFYSKKDYELVIDFDKIRWVDPNDPLRITGKTELEYKLGYLDILIGLKRSVAVKNSTHLYYSLGIRPGIKLQENEMFISFTSKPSTAQNLLVSGNLGLGIKQGFNEHSGIFLEPNFAYYLNQVYKGYGGRNTIAFRVLTGVYFKL